MGSLYLAENPKPATLCNFRKPSTYCAIDNQLTQFHWKRRGLRSDFKMPLAKELLLPLAKDEQRKHKLALGSAPELLLHGCEVPRLLQDHHGVFPRADSRCLLGMFHRALPVHWWSGKAN